MAQSHSILTEAIQARTATPSGNELHALLAIPGLDAADCQALAERLDALPSTDALPSLPLEDVLAPLGALSEWMFAEVAREPTSPGPRASALLGACERVPIWSERASAAMSRLLDEVDFGRMFEIGLPNDRGLYGETVDRLARVLLPRPRDPQSGRELMARLVPTHAAARWLAEIPVELADGLAALVDPSRRFLRLHRATEDSVTILCTRTAAIGLGAEIRERSPACALAASPFYLLPRLCDALFSGIGSSSSCYEQIAAARTALQAVLRHLDRFGVSIDVVYRLEVVEANLDRIADLLMVREATEAAAGLRLAGRLGAARIRDRSLRDVVRTNGRLLARKVVERAGSSGEHYITSSRKEWRLMFYAAAGGGLVTVGTTALKYMILSAHLSLFLEGFSASLNYAGSFLLMQLFGFALATKQPSMIAASLAGSLHGARGDVDLSELVDLIARICRSQFAAAVGNVVVGFLAGMLFDFAWAATFGTPFLSPDKAAHTLRSLDPLHSFTVVFAVVTGVFLWMSSLGAGWLENFVVYRRVIDGIAQHPVGRWVGRSRMARLATRLQHGVAGIGGNVSIGFLLGMTPVLGMFFGIPLEVRHVTLSTVSLAFAIGASGLMGMMHAGVGSAVIGIFLILVCNFGVSFALALLVAMRARGVRNQGLRLVGALWRRCYAAPLDFIRPPAAR